MSDRASEHPPVGSPEGVQKISNAARSTHHDSRSAPLVDVAGQILTGRDWQIWCDGWTHGRADGIEVGRARADAEAAQRHRAAAQVVLGICSVDRDTEGIKGRNRERFSPLKRVAAVAGGRWPEVVDQLALHDLEQQEHDREDGMVRTRPAVALLTHMSEVWPTGEAFTSTADLVNALIFEYPDYWGESSPYGRALTAQRFGRMLATSYGINSTRIVRGGPRGYTYASLAPTWGRMGVAAPVHPDPPQGTGASGADGSTGADESLAQKHGWHLVDGPGRCSTCGAHIEKQGHRDGCPEKETR